MLFHDSAIVLGSMRIQSTELVVRTGRYVPKCCVTIKRLDVLSPLWKCPLALARVLGAIPIGTAVDGSRRGGVVLGYPGSIASPLEYITHAPHFSGAETLRQDHAHPKRSPQT